MPTRQLVLQDNKTNQRDPGISDIRVASILVFARATTTKMPAQQLSPF